MRNSVSEQCDDEGSCFMVADAFRLTRTGGACMSPPPRGDVPPGTRPSQQGQLLLGITFDQGDQGGQMDLRAQLLEHSGAIEASLQAHFAFHRVEIEEIELAAARRLQLRQLEASRSRQQRFDLAFVAYGDADFAPGSSEALVALLSSKLANVGAALSIAFAEVVWSGVPDASSEDPDARLEQWALPAIVASFVGLLLGAGIFTVICFRIRRSRSADTQNAVAAPEGAVSKDPARELGDPEKAGAAADEMKKDADLEVASGSTGDPTDRQGDILDSGSSEGNSSEAGTGQQPALTGANATSGPERDDQIGSTVL